MSEELKAPRDGGALLPSALARPAIDLRQFGFSGHVSDEAMAELRAADRRARLVLATAHQHWFGR